MQRDSHQESAADKSATEAQIVTGLFIGMSKDELKKLPFNPLTAIVEIHSRMENSNRRIITNCPNCGYKMDFIIK